MNETPGVVFTLLFKVLLTVLCKIETSKLLERELLSWLRFCSAVLLDQFDLDSSFELDASEPHVFISVADDVRELRMDIRSVLEQIIPAAGVGISMSQSGFVISDARLRKADADAATVAEKSENRRFCMYLCVIELLPSRG